MKFSRCVGIRKSAVGIGSSCVGFGFSANVGVTGTDDVGAAIAHNFTAVLLSSSTGNYSVSDTRLSSPSVGL